MAGRPSIFSVCVRSVELQHAGFLSAFFLGLFLRLIVLPAARNNEGVNIFNILLAQVWDRMVMTNVSVSVKVRVSDIARLSYFADFHEFSAELEG